MRRAPLLLLLLAVAMRALACALTAIPGRDGVQYLWMAERCAAGDFGGLFATVFHPLYPLLTALPLRLVPGADPVWVGQATSALLGALAVLPLYAVTRTLYGERAALWAGLGYALGPWFCRHPAECMSEGPFYLAATAWAWALLRGRATVAGGLGGAAYLLRPEGAALLLFGGGFLLLRREGAALLRFCVAGLLLSALLPLGFAVWGDGFTLTPKALFNYEVGIGNAGSAASHYLRHLAALPLSAWEGLGWVSLPLMLAGAIARRPRTWRDPAVLLLAPLLLQAAVMPLLRSHYRFVSGLGVLWFPFAGVAFAQLLDAARRRAAWLGVACIALFVAANVAVVGSRNDKRIVERELGRWLRPQLGLGETLASDMPRLDWFAGRRPPPPKPILADELRARARAPQCRFVLWVEKDTADGPAARTEVGVDEFAALGYVPATLPPSLLALTDDREHRIRVLVRPSVR